MADSSADRLAVIHRHLAKDSGIFADMAPYLIVQLITLTWSYL